VPEYFEYPYRILSMRELTPVSGAILDRWFIVFKAYFDSSGKKEDPNTPRVTLACYAANGLAWDDQFTPAWRAVLEKHFKGKSTPGEPYLHMKEAIPLRGGYDRKHGWDEKSRSELIEDLTVNVLGRFNWMTDRAYACTVVVPDYDRAKAERPTLESIEYLALNFCLSHLFLDTPELPNGRRDMLECIFDRCEPYQPCLSELWKSDEERRRDVCLDHIASPYEVDMRKVYPVQAADLLAWLLNRHYTKGDRATELLRAASCLPVHRWYWNYERLKRLWFPLERRPNISEWFPLMPENFDNSLDWLWNEA
jgi:hypothetical protein